MIRISTESSAPPKHAIERVTWKVVDSPANQDATHGIHVAFILRLIFDISGLGLKGLFVVRVDE